MEFIEHAYSMNYDNSSVRRRDRRLAEPDALRLLREAGYGVLSMSDHDGVPYGIPVNYVWDGGECVYVHCAPEGRKLDVLAANPSVSFCVVGQVHLLPGQFTTEYESIVLQATATVVEDDEERWKALRLLLEKLSPDDVATGLKYSEKSFHRVKIIRLHVGSLSGKCKRVGK